MYINLRSLAAAAAFACVVWVIFLESSSFLHFVNCGEVDWCFKNNQKEWLQAFFRNMLTQFLRHQGKEDLTPRVAALREHNESMSSQGTGMLRVAKTTPSRLRALFTSSKVANAATLPVTKKEEVFTFLTMLDLKCQGL